MTRIAKIALALPLAVLLAAPAAALTTAQLEAKLDQDINGDGLICELGVCVGVSD
ncbi:hypothetical protein JQC91_05585 [Jannaschia sp. Os4]|uniref:hypothetical protein n=1 Tax=Jannaschia sp. Os4 TaxID=2807617 RepID=UPI00193A9091|nr:hypothetical protein [Jannaschia sp. Os4]MBM2575772.1 hypothetical protein [Jannaschia sp. Os4]